MSRKGHDRGPKSKYNNVLGAGGGGPPFSNAADCWIIDFRILSCGGP